jgi:hypothetical protein
MKHFTTNDSKYKKYLHHNTALHELIKPKQFSPNRKIYIMKNILHVLFLCVPMFLFGQNDNFLLGIYSGPNVMDRTNELIEDSHESALGYQFGLAALVPLKPEKLYFQTGIQFSNYTQKFGGNDLRWGSQHDGMGGFDETIESGEASIVDGRLNDFFLDIPIGISYYFNQGKWRFFAQPSVDLTYFLTRRSTLKIGFDDPTIESVESVSSGGINSFRSMNLNGSLGLGLERSLTENLSIFLQPTAIIHLFSTAKDSVTGSRLYAFSGRIGMTFRL